MFIEDGKPVILVATDKEPLSSFATFVNQKMDFINSQPGFYPRKYQYPAKLVTKDKYKPTRTIQPTGRPVRATQTWYDERKVAHTIQLKNDLTGNIVRQIPFNGSCVFTQLDWEKVIIFEYLCPTFGIDYEVYDPVSNAKTANIKAKRQRDISNDIYDNVPEADLRVIASSYEIMNADQDDIELVKKSLNDKLMANFELDPDETERTWKIRMRVDEKVKNRALVQTLIDNRIVVMKRSQKKHWYVNDGDKEKTVYGAVLCQSLSKGVPGEFEDLFNYLMLPEQKNDLDFLIGKL